MYVYPLRTQHQIHLTTCTFTLDLQFAYFVCGTTTLCLSTLKKLFIDNSFGKQMKSEALLRIVSFFIILQIQNFAIQKTKQNNFCVETFTNESSTLTKSAHTSPTTLIP